MEINANLPLQSTSFIGREREISEIAALLDQPTCCLLTLIGAGGAGKTRLALEIGRHIAARNAPANGIYFLDLQPIHHSDLLITTFANGIGMSFVREQPFREQLVNHLRDRELLLIIDNFEHLLEGVDLLIEIAKSAPRVKLLVTSREALNVQEEWRWQVGGLQVPWDGNSEHIQGYSAIDLFMDRARRIRQDFASEGNEKHLIRICQLVDGMPLALELAANWTRVLGCAEIANEIQKGLNFLMTSMRNVPERHRSMRAVFEQSWRLLTDAERDIFPKLSVFRGGFYRDAAEVVAGASLHTLAGLVDKSFLRVDASNRYDLHELIRQYGEERLDEQLDDALRTRDLHSAFYADFMLECRDDLLGNRQKEGLERIQSEIDNVRSAFNWSVEQGDLDSIEKSFESLWHLYEIRDGHHEGIVIFGKAAEFLERIINRAEEIDDDQQRLYGFVLTGYARCIQCASSGLEAKPLLEKALGILRRASPNREMVYTLFILVQLTDDYAEAEKLTLEAMEIARKFDFKLWMAQD